jgi:hypothetical protein
MDAACAGGAAATLEALRAEYRDEALSPLAVEVNDASCLLGLRTLALQAKEIDASKVRARGACACHFSQLFTRNAVSLYAPRTYQV